MLQQLGFEADIVVNGKDALEQMRRIPYDLVLMDIQMPIMDGLTATEQIRRLGPAVDQPYIVALTASAIKGDRERFLAAGMNNYLAKPVHMQHLRDIMEQVRISVHTPS